MIFRRELLIVVCFPWILTYAPLRFFPWTEELSKEYMKMPTLQF